jgi:hypothetical protein
MKPQRVAGFGPPRRPLGPALLDVGAADLDVVVVELLVRRRCRVTLPTGAQLVVPESDLR